MFCIECHFSTDRSSLELRSRFFSIRRHAYCVLFFFIQIDQNMTLSLLELTCNEKKKEREKNIVI